MPQAKDSTIISIRAGIAADPRGIDRVTRVEVLDDGPVAATLRIVSEAPGCNALWRDVTVYRGLGRVDIRNTVDKQDILEHESVRFVFPFNFAHPEITMDLAMSEMHPEREQLAGVNKHYYSLLNGMAVGDLEHAVCLTTLDAPFVELGTPSGEDYRLNPRHGYGWWPSAQISPVVYSWVMNNTWRTNYKASQGGVASFRYSLQICDPFDLKLKQRGAEREQPLIAVESGRAEPVGRLFPARRPQPDRRVGHRALGGRDGLYRASAEHGRSKRAFRIRLGPDEGPPGERLRLPRTAPRAVRRPLLLDETLRVPDAQSRNRITQTTYE